MSQFECEVCGAGFEQRSRYERHRMTSHPPRAVSGADLEAAVRGIDFPKGPAELRQVAVDRGLQDAAEVLGQLPDRSFRDAAELTRAFGELRTHESKPRHQPSKLGGQQALSAPSAARIASLLKGVEFPASARELRNHAQKQAGQEEMERLEGLDPKTYHDMAEVMEQLRL